MLQRENRLKRKRDIEIVFENGRFFGASLSTMKLWHITPEKFPKRKYEASSLKIAVIIGKKVSKKAVDRNRLRRQIREVVRLLIKEGKLKTGSMIMIMAKPTMLGKNYEEIERDIKTLLGRGKIIV